MSIKLTGPQYRQLSDIIRETFELGELKRELRFALDINISNITLAGNYEGVVFDVIGDSQRKGWTQGLLSTLREARPQAGTLLAFSHQFDLAPRNTPSRPALQKIIDDSKSFLDIAKWRRNLGRVERQVCAIRMNSKPVGTGFLLGPDVIMTNYHVVSDVIDKSISSTNVEVVFDFKVLEGEFEPDKGVSYSLANDWLIDYSPFSPADWIEPGKRTTEPRPDELDYALLRLAGSPGNDLFGDPLSPKAPTRGWLKLADAPHNFLDSPSLFIVQHPEGEPLKLALDTDSVLDVNDNHTRVIYRTNTEQGSSGSPCFEQDWKLVALHHSGDMNKMPTWNQGIPFTAIKNLLMDRDKFDELDKPTSTSEV